MGGKCVQRLSISLIRSLSEHLGIEIHPLFDMEDQRKKHCMEQATAENRMEQESFQREQHLYEVLLT